MLTVKHGLWCKTTSSPKVAPFKFLLSGTVQDNLCVFFIQNLIIVFIMMV